LATCAFALSVIFIICLSLTTTRLTCLTFQKLFRKNLNRSRLGCKNTTFKGFDANVLQGSAKGPSEGVIQGSARGLTEDALQGSAKGPSEGEACAAPCETPCETPCKAPK
jgi:hypothetical protein